MIGAFIILKFRLAQNKILTIANRGTFLALTHPDKPLFHSRNTKMAKRTRGARMVAAKKRAAKRPGGKGPVKKRAIGRHIMKT